MCIYSQLKAPSSSEVASMIEGVLRHDTEMDVEKQYVDTHGQSEVGFAFCYLLGFALLPRLKNLKKQRLYRPQNGGQYPHLQAILTVTGPITLPFRTHNVAVSGCSLKDNFANWEA